jgi:broad specificity phosphatase PhoE
VKRIHLIRHGQISSNISGALDTAIPGPALTDLGQEQAHALVPTFEGLTIDSMWASTALRAQQTATPLAQSRGFELNILDDLREISAGDLEMSLDPEHRAIYHRTITQWILGDLDARLGNGTSGAEVQEPAVVAHGAIISFWAGVRCTNLTEALFTNYPVVNTGVLTAEPVGVRLDGSTFGAESWKATSWMGVAL